MEILWVWVFIVSEVPLHAGFVPLEFEWCYVTKLHYQGPEVDCVMHVDC